MKGEVEGSLFSFHAPFGLIGKLSIETKWIRALARCKVVSGVEALSSDVRGK